MIPIKIKRSTAPQHFQINWMLHDKCTYACQYCPPSNHAGDDHWLKLDQVLHTCNSLQEQVMSSDPSLGMKILFTGGEPTVWKDFSKLAEDLYSKGWSLNICSNLSRSLDWWKNLSVKWDQFAASVHPEFVDIEEFISKCEYLVDHSASVSARVMIPPDTDLFIKALQYGNKIQDRCPNVYIEWVPIQFEFGLTTIPLSPYTPSQLLIMKSLKSGKVDPKKTKGDNSKVVVWDNQSEEFLIGFNLIKNNLANFKNWKCSAGIDGLFINSKGDIFRGTCLEGGKIGNILDSKVTLPTNSITCSLDFCSCVTDVLYSKEKI